MGKGKKIFLGSIVIIVLVGLATVGFMIVRAASLSVSDTFSDETKIGKGTNKVNLSSGQITLAQCYSPNPSWSLVYSGTTVRDISNLSSIATVQKDIYCDDYNCVLWTYNATAPTTVCIATDPNVYGNILWSKYDYCTGTQPCSTSVTWATSNFSLSTVNGDIGGTHPTNLAVGNNATNVGGSNWLERFYTSAPGTFPAMDACKAKGLGWRLPNILELDSIRGSSPYIWLPNFTGNYYWSSSESNSTNAYVMSSNGNVYDASNKSSGNYVRCARAY